jgi:hypothetical protein
MKRINANRDRVRSGGLENVPILQKPSNGGGRSG